MSENANLGKYQNSQKYNTLDNNNSDGIDFFYDYSLKIPNLKEKSKNDIDPSNILERFEKLKNKMDNNIPLNNFSNTNRIPLTTQNKKIKKNNHNLESYLNNKKDFILNYDFYKKEENLNITISDSNSSNSVDSPNFENQNIIDYKNSNQENIINEVSNLSEQMNVMKQIISSQLIRKNLIISNDIKNNKIDKDTKNKSEMKEIKCKKCILLKSKNVTKKEIINNLKNEIKDYESNLSNIYNLILNLNLNHDMYEINVNMNEKEYNNINTFNKSEYIMRFIKTCFSFCVKINEINKQICNENIFLKREIQNNIELNEKEQVEIDLIYKENKEVIDKLNLATSTIELKTEEINNLTSYIDELHEKMNSFRLENEKLNDDIEALSSNINNLVRFL